MTTFTHDRPTFRERVMALAGHSTWREPVGGHSTHLRQIPADHLVAAALSFGRRGADDIGPDIAFDMATGKAGHYRQVCEWLGKLVCADDSSARKSSPAKRCRPWAAHIAVAAYNALVRGYRVPPAPDGVRQDDWEQLVLYACLLLDRTAEDALALAGRRARAA
jgi:hypothetical protein